ncbi:MAG: hypothetical protein GY703_00775 [Gammaproteobacteria bacterium]|nr:hypothetical protein [Gammaproteobacteria bacterium]
MKNPRQKEIESLKVRLSALEAEQQREEQERESLDQAYQQLMATLDEADVSFESFVRCYHKNIRKFITKIEREQSKLTEEKTTQKPTSRKKAVRKKKRRTKKAAAIKIPAGSYTNIPPDTGKVFEVKEKGPRPKVVKAFAEEIGLEAFLSQCQAK